MTLDDAIQHCEEVANRLRTEDPCSQCAAEHTQLMGWLKELKELNLSESPTGSS